MLARKQEQAWLVKKQKEPSAAEMRWGWGPLGSRWGLRGQWGWMHHWEALAGVWGIFFFLSMQQGDTGGLRLRMHLTCCDIPLRGRRAPCAGKHTRPLESFICSFTHSPIYSFNEWAAGTGLTPPSGERTDRLSRQAEQYSSRRAL